MLLYLGVIISENAREGATAMIQLKNVTKVFEEGDRKVHALRKFSLNVKKGEFIFVVGRNTSGKSTLFNLITREIQPTEGKLIVDGIDLSTISDKELPYYRRMIGVVFQDFRLLSNMDVFDNVAYAMRVLHNFSEKEVRKRVAHVLDLVGLAKNNIRACVHQLSGGERQRVAIARAMINNPKILLADEPTGNIDPEMKKEIFRLLRGISAQQGTTVLMVTHDQELVKQFAGRVVTLDSGELVYDEIHRVAPARMPGGMFSDSGQSLLSGSEAQSAASIHGGDELGRLDNLLTMLNNRYGASA